MEQRTLARLFTRWQGVVQPRRGLDALLDVIENLQGAPLPASHAGDGDFAGARCWGIKPCRSGHVDCGGRGGVGRDGPDRGARWADWALSGGKLSHFGQSLRCSRYRQSAGEAGKIMLLRVQRGAGKRGRCVSAGHGASFFQDLHDGVGGGYPGETLDALWNLVWRGLLTNDAMHALRAYCGRPRGEYAEAGTSSQSAGGVSIAADDSADRTGAVGLNAAAFARTIARRRSGAMRWRSSC